MPHSGSCHSKSFNIINPTFRLQLDTMFVRLDVGRSVYLAHQAWCCSMYLSAAKASERLGLDKREGPVVCFFHALYFAKGKFSEIEGSGIVLTVWVFRYGTHRCNGSQAAWSHIYTTSRKVDVTYEHIH